MSFRGSANEKEIANCVSCFRIRWSRKKSYRVIKCICFEKYDVDLFLLRHEGELMREIPSAVNLLPEIRAYTVLARPIKRTLKEGHFILSMARLAGKMAAAKI